MQTAIIGALLPVLYQMLSRKRMNAHFVQMTHRITPQLFSMSILDLDVLADIARLTAPK